MPLAYIAAPYTEKSAIVGKRHVYGEIKDLSYRNFLDMIESAVKDAGFDTFLPHRDIHQWGKIYIEPEIVMKRAFSAIKECDLFIAFPEHVKGPNTELGMAAALGKKSLIIQHEKDVTSLVHAGLNGVAPTRLIKFTDLPDMKMKLRETLKDFMT